MGRRSMRPVALFLGCDQLFVASRRCGANDELQESGSNARATEGNDFAHEGRGALEGEQEDVEGVRAEPVGPISNNSSCAFGLGAAFLMERYAFFARSYAGSFARIAVSCSMSGAKLGRERMRSTNETVRG